MKRQTCTLVAAAFAAGILFASASAIAQGPAQPTEHHKMLQNDVGTWDADCQVWPMPGAPPQPFQGVETNKLLDGKMWILSDFEADLGPLKFVGHGVYGYDTHEKKYVGNWIDNMSTGQSVMSGEYDAEKKTLTMHTEGRDPSGELMKMKNVTHYKDKDHKVFEMYVPGEDGEWFKMMEMDMTRRK